MLFLTLGLCIFHICAAQATTASTCSSKDQQEDCANSDNIQHDINKYSEGHNIYARLIEDAVAAHVPCNRSNACDCYSAVIGADLLPYRAGISRAQIDAVAARGTRYQIIDHRLYRQPDCMFPSRCAGIEHFIRAQLAHLPDLEVIINCRDWPQIQKPHAAAGRAAGPVFSFSKTSAYADIMYPAWSFWEGGPAISLYPTGLGRWDQQRERIAGAAGRERWPWSEKRPVAFFRGSRTSAERDALVQLARRRPDLVDAQYTRNQAWKSPADTLGAEPAAEVALEEHCAYKYLFNFRGVAASFRLKHLFLCGSLVFHVGDDWLEFFYPALRPWVHYVPVRADAGGAELQRLVEFFRERDDLALAIAQRGYEHIWQRLDLPVVQCYWRRLLRAYARLLQFDVERNRTLIAV